MPKTKITPAAVGDLAEKYLEKHQPAEYRILIDRTGIQEDEDGWWEVPIRPSKEGVPSYDWIGRSAEAAGDMDEAEGVHVLFM
jgi:hypothetical protein